MLDFFKHQKQALDETANNNKCAYYHDMGLGKTFTGAEKLHQLNAKVNLVICQKSKINDWIDHFTKYYESHFKMIYDCTLWDKYDWQALAKKPNEPCVMVINYELAFRRPELKKLTDFTLLLDESSLIQNETAKRSKFIISLNAKNVILLSGTPTGGKYELLWSQLHLLGWNISKKLYWKQYVDTEVKDVEGYPITIVKGYKNVDRLKRKMRQYGCHFLKTDDVMDLPEQVTSKLTVNTSKDYRKFKKDCICTVGDNTLVGDTTLTKMLYERQLCGQYSVEKLDAFRSLLESTNDRLIVFYNFNDELETLKNITWEYTQNISEVNGSFKDLTAYEQFDDSITFIQYQAGAMGLNLQKANKIVYFTPPLSSELFEQSKKRIHRIGQKKTCFYYYLTCKSSIEEKIYKTLAMRKDYTDALFERGD